MTLDAADPVSVVVGRVASKIVLRAMMGADEGERRCFRVKNLTPAEISAFIVSWAGFADAHNLSGVQIVVSGDTEGNFPQEYRAAEGHPITYYRNHNTGGLIYLETKVESDEQGLKNIFTLRDSNFLDGSFDAAGFGVRQEILTGAWATVTGREEVVPRHLEKNLLDVLNGLHQPGHITVSVRRFVYFAVAVMSERAGCDRPLSPEETDQLVGRHLTQLDLFPDESWRVAGSESRVARRLQLNAMHADLQSSPTSDADPDALADKASAFIFRETDGNELPADQQVRFRGLCVAYCTDQTRELRAAIPYGIFEQLFRPDAKGLPLGERVRTDISAAAPDRLKEFDDLNLRDGLDRRIAEDAQRLLDAEPAEETLAALRDLLQPLTRRMVEKAANPVPERFFDPLIKIAEVARTFRDRHGDIAGLELHLVPGRTPAGCATSGLFAFLFGQTLNSVVTASQLGDGLVLKVPDELLRPGAPPALRADDADDPDDEAGEVIWPPLSISFRLFERDNQSETDFEPNLEWFPDDEAVSMLALFWLLSAAPDQPNVDCLLQAPADGFELWQRHAVARLVALDSLACSALKDTIRRDPLVARALDLRNHFRSHAGKCGLSAELCRDVYDKWTILMNEAKLLLTPDGYRDERLGALLGADTVARTGGSILMLASHPLRLRWIGHYLSRSEELAIKALAGELPLNPQNPRRYLNWISQLTPHQQPAMICDRDASFIYASREIGWAEEYTPRRDGVGGALDSASVNEIGRQIICYLEAHPFKLDGLSILIIGPNSPALPTGLVSFIRRGEWRDTRIDLHVLAPRRQWEEITSAFSELSSGNRLSQHGRLFPPQQLRLYDIAEGLEASLGDIKADLAVLPHLLQDNVREQQNTEPCTDGSGSFNPLLDRPIHIYGGIQGGSISVAMRPRAPDTGLEAWSTMTVRHHRTRAVSQQQPENTDFIELRHDFEAAAKLFIAAHQKCHWVITLERHITRQQIEMLEPRPDILSVRDGVGSGGLYTVIVSSNSGRGFVIERLIRKLRKLVPEHHLLELPDAAAELAARIYDETRRVAPRLLLQALGISRVTEEVLGLTIARTVAERLHEAAPRNGLTAWLSLDEHAEWFGGARADLCRVVLEETDSGDLEVDLLVLEGKLRQSYDPHGVEQVASTLGLLRHALVAPPDAAPPMDAVLWREELLKAIENTSPEARILTGTARHDPNGRRRIPEALRSAFREGRYRVRAINGLYSICLYDSEGVQTCSEEKDVTIVRTFRGQILDLIDRRPDRSPAIPGPVPDPSPLSDASPAPASRSPEPSVEQRIAFVSNSASGEREKMPADSLERRYQTIIDTFNEFDIRLQVPAERKDRFVEGPATILFRLRPAPGTEPRRLSEKADALKLALHLEEKQNIRFSIDSGYVLLDVPKRDDERYYVNATHLWSCWQRPEDGLSAPLGEDRFGNPVALDFSSPNSPHLLVGGTTGSGKSEALNSLLHGLIHFYDPQELRLHLIDPKGTELQHLAEDPHVEGEIGWDDQDAVGMLHRCVEEMQSRYQIFRLAGTRSITEYNRVRSGGNRMPWWVVVLDEYADLTSDADAKRDIEAALKRLAQKARAAGIHVIIATQKPSADVISTNLRSNLPAQLALRVKSGTESRVIMDDSGAEMLNGRGDAFLKTAAGLTRIQCAKVEL
ncbi:FtsK/SpoIIIE domain-containing protein [Novispirillum sp. DQ9]|uniref:FtsK/SpoIIIE domain-containing protein n=1 Tax=Novispirillum sp. DQ9 TaxID=3398612 RepID=UPI003C7D8243